jgi:hypothetical protein
MGDGIDPVPGLNVFLGDRGRADDLARDRPRDRGSVLASAAVPTNKFNFAELNWR